MRARERVERLYTVEDKDGTILRSSDGKSVAGLRREIARALGEEGKTIVDRILGAHEDTMTIHDPEFADLIEDGREPSRSEIAALMRRYLSEPVNEETVDRLYRQFREVLSDEERRTTEELAFRANGRRYFGQAWKERLSPQERMPAPAELALWLAIVTSGFPRPRPFCPAELAGTWQSESGGIWSLSDDGSFSTTDERIGALRAVRWCVHLVVRKGDFRRDQLWLLGDTRHNVSYTSLLVLECKPSSLRLLQSRGDFGNIEYQLSRIVNH